MKVGRPKLKVKERKEVFPMRFSKAELTVFQQAAGDTPVREWIRLTLLTAAVARSGEKVAALVEAHEAVRKRPA
jgi:hypothetical protein